MLVKKPWQDHILRNDDRHLQNLTASLFYALNLIHLDVSFTNIQNYIYALKHMPQWSN